MNIDIDRGGCISCGLCEATCPAVFRIADDGAAEVCHQPTDGVEEAAAQEAADGCPVSVINIAG